MCYWLTCDQSQQKHQDVEFHNGADAIVPGYVMLPKSHAGSAPARRPCILLLHGHGGPKDSVCLDDKARDHAGTQLVQKGYIVAAVDGYFHGERMIAWFEQHPPVK